jgi:phospholipase C
VSTVGEYHEILVANPSETAMSLQHKPYGLGPRVPMYVLSPWSRGGWVNSEVADHTSVIRFIEKRFGVQEPNITPWRRSVCGDLTSAFDFGDPHNTRYAEDLPDTSELAERARALPSTTTPVTPVATLPVQARGARPSRALPYELHTHAQVKDKDKRITLTFTNNGKAGACIHVYDRKHLDRVPRRYTVSAGKSIEGSWDLGADGGAYDLWVLGPNGFHRHFTGGLAGDRCCDGDQEIKVGYEPSAGKISIKLRNEGRGSQTFLIKANAYDHEHATVVVPGGCTEHRSWSLKRSGNWYDLTVKVAGVNGWSRRLAGRLETGRDSFSDPAMGGPAHGEQG